MPKHRDAATIRNKSYRQPPEQTETYTPEPTTSKEYNAFNCIESRLIKNLVKTTKRAEKAERINRAKSTAEGRLNYLDTNRERAMTEETLHTVFIMICCFEFAHITIFYFSIDRNRSFWIDLRNHSILTDPFRSNILKESIFKFIQNSIMQSQHRTNSVARLFEAFKNERRWQVLYVLRFEAVTADSQ